MHSLRANPFDNLLDHNPIIVADDCPGGNRRKPLEFPSWKFLFGIPRLTVGLNRQLQWQEWTGETAQSTLAITVESDFQIESGSIIIEPLLIIIKKVLI